MSTIPSSSAHRDTPLGRGYWTDEELLDWAGAESVAIIKHMQRERLLKPRLEKTDSGQNARAWELAEVLRVATVVDLVGETGFNLSACASVAGLLGVKALDVATSAMQISHKVAAMQSSTQSRDKARSRSQWINLERLDLLQLAIVDRRLVYALERTDEAKEFRATCVGRLADLKASPPQIDAIVRGAPKLSPNDLNDERSVLRIKLANLARRPLELVRTHLA